MFGVGQDQAAARTRVTTRNTSCPWSIRAYSLPYWGLGLYLLLYLSGARDIRGVLLWFSLLRAVIAHSYRVNRLSAYIVVETTAAFSSTSTHNTSTKNSSRACCPPCANCGCYTWGSDHSETISWRSFTSPTLFRDWLMKLTVPSPPPTRVFVFPVSGLSTQHTDRTPLPNFSRL